MSEPLDLEPIEARLEHVAYGLQARKDVRNLLAEVVRLRDEIADRANVEADPRAQLVQAWDEALSAGMTYAREDDDWYEDFLSYDDEEDAPQRPPSPRNPYREAAS